MRTIRSVVLVLLAGAVLVIVGCAQTVSQKPASLEGVIWTLASTSVTDLDVSGLNITAEFAEGRMAGFSGVNSYTGAYKAESDGKFSAGPFTSTLMAGPEPAMKAEGAYLKLLEDAESYEVTDSTLRITTSGGKTLDYKATKPVELSGSSWTVTGYNNGKDAVQSVEEGSELTLEFGADGKVSGNAGVNTFSGEYKVDGDKITIGPLSSTMMTGPENLMAQEQAYLVALQASTKFSISNKILTLRNDAGAMQVTAK